MRYRGRAVAVAATAVVLSVLGAPGPAVSTPTRVEPASAPRGADPSVGWYDRDTRTLHVEGLVVPVELPGAVVRVRRAARGYIVQRARGGADLLDHVDLHGRTRRLARAVLDWEVVTGPDAGHRVAVLMAPRPGRVVVRVVRVADARLLAVRPAESLHDFHRGRVWIDVRGGRLATWRPATGDVVRAEITRTLAVDARHGAVARRAGGCLRIVPQRRPADRTGWCAPENGFGGWSPDGRHVLTYTLPPDADGVTHKLVVRNARTGRYVRAFRGYLGVRREPRWEAPGRLLVAASDAGPQRGEAALMRLRLDGRVVRASRLGGTWPWEVRRLPISSR